ncbi:MAG: 4Fe-4S binding protein [Rhodobacteraceae bacterium]|nr:4Fe-4S binding protein [Paracoccaceae bacterium]
MADAQTKCLICNCEKTMTPDLTAIEAGQEAGFSPVHTQLCRSQLKSYERYLAGGDTLLVGCTQEAPLFSEIAEEAGAGDRVRFVNLRETAGWSDEGAASGPKMAALLAAAQYAPRPAPLREITSDGLCLVIGAGQPALEAAELLSARLSVSLLLTGGVEDLLPPRSGEIAIYSGAVAAATGAFGSFDLTVDGFAAASPASRAGLSFEPAKDGAKTSCAVILDLTGGTPLFSGHRHRDGYLRADPGDPAAVLRAVLEAGELSGTFEKPLYVDYVAETCAHSRSNITGCSKCLDACPAGAIVSLGDGVEIDPLICGGCGSCASVCPTGSISYRYPDRPDMIGRAQVMAEAYGAAGGDAPVLLLHDGTDGADLVAAMARFGRGLPARVIPQEMHAPTTLGHVEMAGILASGFVGVVALVSPKNRDELAPLETEATLARAILDGLGAGAERRIEVICEADPDVVEAALWALEPGALEARAFSAVGAKRDIARVAFGALAQTVPDTPIPLPDAAPYGRIDIDPAKCTLCMACVSACPTGAMMDTPGEPTLRFTEAACVQCGLCIGTCPETALGLHPQLNLAPSAMEPETLYQEAPFECVSCGTPFATQSAIARIKEQLAGKHTMFATPERARLIEMCDDCRIKEQADSPDDPFAMGARARTRTTEDYIRVREGTLSPDDFIIDD